MGVKISLSHYRDNTVEGEVSKNSEDDRRPLEISILHSLGNTTLARKSQTSVRNQNRMYRVSQKHILHTLNACSSHVNNDGILYFAGIGVECS
jgi:hypothetical protein